MAITYTDNLQLGLQLTKTDYVSWDTIQDNWRKIDEAVGSSGVRAGDATIMLDGVSLSRAGTAETIEE